MSKVILNEPVSSSQQAVDESQLRAFDERGVIKVKSAFDAKMASDIECELWRRFQKWGIEPAVPESWESLDEATIRKVMKGTRRVRGLESIYNARSDAIASALARETDLEKQKALLLLTFSGRHDYIPDQAVPSSIWHSDTPNVPGEGLTGVIVLGFINHVRPRGGGTMVITGSHRLFETSTSAITSKMAKRRLKKYPYFRELLSSKSTNRERFFNEPGYVNDIELKVVELTGEPGDVYFVNGSVLHTIARNYQPDPRMMVRGFYGTSKLSTHYKELFTARAAKKQAAASVS
ncbi:MAG: phytanoyl-CoA dioxygenase family protein [Gammaproteobacteria bacterium]|nr:phytanoyl-CoA dioxygenase family protein [Gammaproteobacteria bacterium]